VGDLRQLGERLLLVDELLSVEVAESGPVEADAEVGAEDTLPLQPVDALERLVQVLVNVWKTNVCLTSNFPTPNDPRPSILVLSELHHNPLPLSLGVFRSDVFRGLVPGESEMALSPASFWKFLLASAMGTATLYTSLTVS
jgi:hypothetical protein